MKVNKKLDPYLGKVYKIPFNLPYIKGNEAAFIKKAISSLSLAGDGTFSKQCQQVLKKELKTKAVFLTPSGTAALEMAAIMCDLKAGDEIIMPSFTFSSTANAFVLRGAKIVFVDIEPSTMNINHELVEKAITKKTKAIVVVHYGGVTCDMKKIMSVARKYKLLVVEDAAQALGSTFDDKKLGTFGHFGCFSFHETKNITCGEGGAIAINDHSLIARAEIIREKGTNRTAFYRGQIDKYTWVDMGSSFLISEINAAFLYAQLRFMNKVNKIRLRLWQTYFDGLQPLVLKGRLELLQIPAKAKLNGHLFYIKTKDIDERSYLINFLEKHGVLAVFHYIPLHSSPAGKKFGRFCGQDRFTTKESQRLLRLPLYAGLKLVEVKKIIDLIKEFYDER